MVPFDPEITTPCSAETQIAVISASWPVKMALGAGVSPR